MQTLYRLVNFETGEIAEGSAMPEHRSFVCGIYYRKALSWARDNVRCGLLGLSKCHKRGVHLYAIANGLVAWEVRL